MTTTATHLRIDIPRLTSQRLWVSIVALSIQAAALAPDLQAAGPRLQLDSPILRLAQHARSPAYAGPARTFTNADPHARLSKRFDAMIRMDRMTALEPLE